jgi:endoglucanase
VTTMLLLYERYPQLLADGALDIPESGNGVSDLLDELRYELDWVLTMQDPDDGGVYFKLTSKKFPGMIMPHEDQSERFVVGKSTASALDFAGMTAQAARVWRKLDAPFAARCEQAAVRAWRWGLAHPDVVFRNPPGVETGAYSPTNHEADLFHAAAQLLVTTGGDEHLAYVRAHLAEIRMTESGSWADYVYNVGAYVLADSPSRLAPEERERVRRSIVALGEELLGRLDKSPGRLTLGKYSWGSNGVVCDEAIVLAKAFEYSGEPRFLVGVVDLADWIFGRNANSQSFVTGFGLRRPMHIHHRASEADGIAEPIPGFLVGGPNSGREDDVAKAPWGVKYPSSAPAKCYVDLMGSYASNEVCINWNASLVYVLGFLQAQRAGLNDAP